MSVSWATEPRRNFTSSELLRGTRRLLADLLGLSEKSIVLRPIEDPWAPRRYASASQTPSIREDVVIGPSGGTHELAFVLEGDVNESEFRTVSIGTVPGRLWVGEAKSDSGRALALAVGLAAAQLGESLFLEADDLWPWAEEGPYEVDPAVVLDRFRQPLSDRPIEQAAIELFRGTKIGDPVPADYVPPGPPKRLMFVKARPPRPN